MTETQKPEDQGSSQPANQDQMVTRSGTIMTHLMTYSGANGTEYRLHDAEYKGRHYFDFRRYDPRTAGGLPTRGGVRLNPRMLEFLEDAMMKWRRFYKQAVVRDAKRDV